MSEIFSLKQDWLLNSNRGCFAWLAGKVFADSLETGPMETLPVDKMVIGASYRKPDFSGSLREVGDIRASASVTTAPLLL
jgi:hypothetical protein